MAGEGTYVKLSEDHNPLQNVTPGELNQAIDIEKVPITYIY